MSDFDKSSTPSLAPKSPQSGDIRTRIAAAIYNGSDEYARKLMARPDLPGASEIVGDAMPVCYKLADAVIRELPTAYVVTSGSYSDYEVKRVYLTREEAELFVELRSTVRGYDECRIEEFPIGAGRAEYDGPGYRASWSITHDGIESEHCMETWLTGSYLRPVEKRGIQHNYRRFVMVEGIDRDQVLKVLRDAATQGRAEYEGVSGNLTFRINDD